MYTLTRENGHNVWKEQWYALTSRISLRTDLYMIHEDQIFIVNVVVMDLIQEMVVMNVINRLTNVITKLNTIVKIYKYKKIHEGHHFIPMAMEVHGALERDMDCFIRESVRLFHDR
jgi:hypothetical protein